MTMREKMTMDAIESIVEELEYGYSGCYCDLHDRVFNSDYYIIGINEAREVLNEYDVFEAIWEVQDYEDNNFGERYTDCSNPEKLVNMLFYIIGSEVIDKLVIESELFSNNWNELATDEINEKLIEILKTW